MKKIVVVLAIGILVAGTLFGCATSKLTTDIGTKIGGVYAKAAEKGLPTGDQIAKNWPYVGGLIRGLLGAELEQQQAEILSIMNELDKLAALEKRTDADNGRMVGLVVRLEVRGGQALYNAYGSTIIDALKAVAGGL